MSFEEPNYVPLTPLSFLFRAAAVFPERIALVHGEIRQTWRTTSERCVKLASALRALGIKSGEIISVLAPNVPAIYEAHFGVPLAGAVLNTLNTRLKPEEIAFQLQHSGARMLLVDVEFAETAAAATAAMSNPPLLVDIEDDLYNGPTRKVGALTYEALLHEAGHCESWQMPEDERSPIALNYTSGTTGDPKGVITHHRGAHLNSLSQIVVWNMPQNPVYIWTLPMFHCNGWCFPWSIAAQGGTNICLRKVDPFLAIDLMQQHGVSHMCGAPIVYSMIIDELTRRGGKLKSTVHGMVAGAAPSTALIEAADAVCFDLLHVYGLTETYGPAAACVKQPEWKDKSVAERARLNARQGVAMFGQASMKVLNPKTLEPVPADGVTVGEIMFRGNTMMTGYLRNPGATASAFAENWYHTGDLAVLDPDGYARITDRSKDVIISGGENISSLEVEDVLHRHPAASLAAVVARPDKRWGEVPHAFVEVRRNHDVSDDELRAFCRSHLAGFKVPKYFTYMEIPKTSTGKTQKAILRDLARAGAP